MRVPSALWAGVGGVLVLGSVGIPVSGTITAVATYVYTAVGRCDLEAWARGAERFPEAPSIRFVSAGESRQLAPGFYASADPEVSFDAQRILFAAKQRREDPWQIWEVSVSGGAPRRVTNCPEDNLRPLYLPDNSIVYARKTAHGLQLETVPLHGGRPLRITYGPGNFLPSDVLHDGRILYEGGHPTPGSSVHELYAVYPDGSGVETFRCDHGVSRHGARQVASGDVVFGTEKGFARFTSALATQLEVAVPRAGEFAGPVAEVASDIWLVSLRASSRAPYAIYSFSPSGGPLRKISTSPGVQPAVVAPRELPRRFPSGLHDWEGANLLCLNAYTSKTKIIEGSIGAVRLYSQSADGKSALLGETAVENDGSFFLHVPADQPLQMELRDRSGNTIAAEHGWFWMRRGEQRVCVGCHAGPERAPENAVPKVLLRQDVPVRMPAAGGQ